jgi:hypothetical protein
MSTESVGVDELLADFLRARRDEIIRVWMDKVSADPAIHTGALTSAQLRDHMPRIIDDMAHAVRNHGREGATAQFDKDAEKHGAERWQQGFEVHELLREIMHLRAVFVYYLRVFEESHPDLGSTARLFVQATTHRFLDELAIEGTERFLRAEKQARAATLGIASGAA